MPQARSEEPRRGLVRIYMLGAVPARPRAEMGVPTVSGYPTLSTSNLGGAHHWRPLG